MAEKKKSSFTNELKLTRLYDAPVSLVWEAWTDPKKVAKWWGPRGFTLTTHSKDLRPGGHWRYTMHGPDGVNYENKTLYHQVEKHSLLVYDHGGSDDRPPLFRVTVRFSDLKGKTKMEMTMAFATPEVAQETKKFIKKAGGDSTWDRLAEYLSEESSGKKQFVINRSFDAPIDLVFEAWTDPKHFEKWLPPVGFTMQYMTAPEVKVGGSTFYKMTDGASATMYGKAHYVEISKPNRLVYRQQFCDSDGKMSRHPMVPVWPEMMLTVVGFHEESSDQTRVTVTWEPQGTVSREELDAFIQMRGGMTMGWTGSFDKLEEYLANLS